MIGRTYERHEQTNSLNSNCPVAYRAERNMMTEKKGSLLIASVYFRKKSKQRAFTHVSIYF